MKVRTESTRDSPPAGLRWSVSRLWSAQAVTLSLFFSLWFVYGLAVNSRNQFEFNLQHAGIEAIVERRHFYLEGSPTPRFQMQVYYYDGGKPFGDVFERNGHQYAAKQPGQFMTGATDYFVLHLFGLDYKSHYTLTSSLVSFLTTSLVTALAAIAIFGTVRELTTRSSIGWPLACALSFGLGTTAFVYSGFAYHDSLAAGYLAIAFYLAVVLARRSLNARAAKMGAVACGLFLGWTLTTSMLPFLMTCVVALYIVSVRKWNLTLLVLLGGVIGIAPLLIFNAVSFGNPLLNSYMAGGYPESMLHLNLTNSVDKVRLYLSEITLYVPVAWMGILGLTFFPRSLRREQIAIALVLVAQAFQILNIESHGGCHFGPRFLLPAMPFVSISLAGFSYIAARSARFVTATVTAVLAAFAVFVSSLGAAFTAMYCDVGRYGLWPALENFRALKLSDFPLAPWLMVPTVVSIAALIYFASKQKHARSKCA